MSASREKKTRQDLSGSGWNDPKTAREAKQRQKEHSTNLLYGTIGVVFLVIAIAAVIWKSNIIPKTATAATVNGEKYTAAEVNFYFENYYQNFVNGNYSILSMIGLDTGTSLKAQTISSSAVMFVTDATEGETWYDYFADKALEQAEGRSISDIFADGGESYFRTLETRVLTDLCRREGMVLATGGGAVLRRENRTLLKGSGLVIFLDRSPWAIRRTLRRQGRPLLPDDDALFHHAVNKPTARQAAEEAVRLWREEQQ